MEEFIKEAVVVCKEKGFTSSKEIGKFIFDVIYKDYKGKASKGKIKAVSDDITESVCLKLGISC